MTPRVLARKNALDTVASLLLQYEKWERANSRLQERERKAFEIDLLESRIAIKKYLLKDLIDEITLKSYAKPFFPESIKQLNEKFDSMMSALEVEERQLLALHDRRVWFFKNSVRKANAFRRLIDKFFPENRLQKIVKSGKEYYKIKGSNLNLIEMLCGKMFRLMHLFATAFRVLSSESANINAPPLYILPQIAPNAPAL